MNAGENPMHDAEEAGESSPLQWVDGTAYFRGRPVEHRHVEIAGMSLTLAAMKDAADLLDEPDYARRFLDNDIAPYGVELWPAAIMLAEHLVEESRKTARSSVPSTPPSAIELGCGLGLVSIVVARLGWRVTASDYESTALAFARYNAQRNEAPITEWMTLDWRHPPPGRRFDRVLGADVLYQLTDHRPIMDCIDRLLAPGGAAILADPHRGIADRFPETASSAGFEVTVQPTAATLSSGRTTRGRIFRLYRANSALNAAAR